MLNSAPTRLDASSSNKRLDYTSSPGHLRASAHLYGIDAPALADARVLELGCGAAENLLPLASAYPGARITGTDVSPDSIRLGQQAAEHLNLANLALHTLAPEAICNWQPESAPFDYILVRGIYSTLGTDLQRVLLSWCQRMLSPDGVLFVDYATNPGAKASEIVRDAIMLHAHDATTEEEVKAGARAALTLFQNGLSASNPLAAALSQTAGEFARELSDESGSASPLLLGSNACYLIEFTDCAMQAGLAYVGDALPLTELPHTYGQNVALTQSLLALGRPKVMRQQYLDFSNGRMTRHSMLVHQDKATSILAKPDLARLKNLRWASGLLRASIGTPMQGLMYLSHTGKVLNTKDELTAALLDALAHAWPASVSYEALHAAVENALCDRPGLFSTEALDNALQSLLHRGLLYYCLEAGPYDLAAGAPLALVGGICQAVHAKPSSAVSQFNLWHEAARWKPNPVEKTILKKLAAGQSLPELVAHMRQAHEKNGEQYGVAFAGPVASVLAHLKRYGGLNVSDAAWLAFLRAGLADTEHAGPFWHLYISALARDSYNRNLTYVKEPVPPSRISSALAVAGRRLAELANGESYSEAIPEAQRLVRKYPKHFPAWEVLVYSLCRTGRINEALVAALQLLDIAPMRSLSYNRLGECLTTSGRALEALACGRRNVEIDPAHAVSHLTLADALPIASRYAEAELECRRAIELDPNLRAARTNLVNILCQRGDPIAAEIAAREGLKVFPTMSTLHNNRLFATNYAPEKSAEEVFEAYQEFERALCQPLYADWKPFSNSRNPRRRLKIAYVSPDYRLHSGNEFLEPLLSHHDREQFEITAYAELKAEDATTQRFKKYFDHWVPTRGVSAAALADQVRADGIDILVDLAGHTGNNRLSVFARKPAPVSVTWLGFGYTTGITAIDYILTDAHMAPAGSEALFAERPWRLANGSLVYRAKPGMGPVGELPALKRGHVTLGTLSRSIRINDRTIRVWSEILRRLPRAQLIMDSGSFGEPHLQEEMAARFARHGVPRERLKIGKNSPPWNVLRNMDIGLDCFPHNSGVTLVETLYMGVPYVTLADRPSVGRIGSSILHSAGCPEWVAHSEEEYIEKVVALAGDLPTLAQVRASLRERLQASPLMDEAGFTRQVEAGYREMFAQWCEAGQ